MKKKQKTWPYVVTMIITFTYIIFSYTQIKNNTYLPIGNTKIHLSKSSGTKKHDNTSKRSSKRSIKNSNSISSFQNVNSKGHEISTMNNQYPTKNNNSGKDYDLNNRGNNVQTSNTLTKMIVDSDTSTSSSSQKNNQESSQNIQSSITTSSSSSREPANTESISKVGDESISN